MEIARKKLSDLIILDIQMPVIAEYEVCKILSADEITEEIPIIFMTANSDDKSTEKAYKAGGVDYIVKPVRKLELISRAKIYLKLSNTIKKLEKAVITDGLTALYNHNKIFEMKRAKRYKYSLSSFDDIILLGQLTPG